MENPRPRISFFQRKPRSVGNYSVEFIFDDVRARLSNKIDAKVIYSKYPSNGVLKRLYNVIEASLQQSEVNHVTGDINYLGLLLSKRRTVHTILDCVFLTNNSGIKKSILKYFWLTMPVNRARYVTAISNSTKNEILKHVKCDPRRIKVIYVAISDRFKPVPFVFNCELPRILQIGTAPNKNIPVLIKALQGIPCILEIIGKPNADYESMLRNYQIQYEYKSGLTDEEIVSRYIAADIVSLVSTYEGFGMPILEAQATGRPVITSNLFSMPEVAGDAACIVDPYDVGSVREGILKIISDKTYRQTLISRGYKNVERFSPEEIANQYLELYLEISQN